MFWLPPRSNPDFVPALKDRFFDNVLRLGPDIDAILKSAQRPKKSSNNCGCTNFLTYHVSLREWVELGLGCV